MPLIDSFKQLLNNEHLADVRFEVGQCGESIYAHKLILMMASKVFYKQFNGSFAKSKRDTLMHPVIIDDIEPAPFIELLRYIYSREVKFPSDNILEVYYASEKYMMKNLGKICEDQFCLLINDETALKILEQNRRYEFSAVDTICLKIICDNPLKYFKQEAYLTLSYQAVQLIASCRAMNCLISQLDDAIIRWKQNYEKNQQGGSMEGVEKVNCDVNIDIEIPLKKLCRKKYFSGKYYYSTNIDTSFLLQCKRNKLDLYGMGIYVGVEDDSPVPGSTVDISVSINKLTVAKGTFHVLDEVKIYDIMFERQTINQQAEITVKVNNKDQYKMLHLTGFYSYNTMLIKGDPYRHNNQLMNCVAYLFVADQ